MNRILILILLLSGCGQEIDTESFDTQSEGLRVRYSDDGPHEPSAESLLTMFHGALQCADIFTVSTRAGMPVKPPLVAIVFPGSNDPFDGLTYYHLGMISVEREWIGDRKLWMHEFERWIAFSRGVPIDEIDGTPELKICGRLG